MPYLLKQVPQQGPLSEERGSAASQVSSGFSPLLQLFSRGEFEWAVKLHEAERRSKGPGPMAVCFHVILSGGAEKITVRGVLGLACCEAPRKHMGLQEAPKKSTTAHANKHAPQKLDPSLHKSCCGKIGTGIRRLNGKRKDRAFPCAEIHIKPCNGSRHRQGWVQAELFWMR